MGQGYSLHIGLNFVDPGEYDGWDGELRGCENDARDMANIAKSLKYAKSRTLLTKEATSGRVIDALLDLSHTLKGGDLLFLTYSGHGGQVEDVSSDEDDDLDETWCLTAN